jgi:hypothetical protein
MTITRHILVIRRNCIGDRVCTTPLIGALRRRHPRAHIAALVNICNGRCSKGTPIRKRCTRTNRIGNVRCGRVMGRKLDGSAVNAGLDSGNAGT